MNATIRNRLRKLEEKAPRKDDDPFSHLSYFEKKVLIRQYYAEMIHADHTLSETEYEDLLLEHYPEVLTFKTWPKEPSKKPIEEMTRAEKEACLTAHFIWETYAIADKRGLVFRKP